jgi:hypothetical protein
MDQWCFLPWLLPSLNWLLAANFRFSRSSPPNMPVGPSKKRFDLMKHNFCRVVRPDGMAGLWPSPWSLKLLMCMVFWLPFPHANSDLSVLWLVGLVWTRATTPWSWIFIFTCWKLLFFPTPQMSKSGACSSSILCPFLYSCLYLSIIFRNTYTHVKDKEKC